MKIPSRGQHAILGALAADAASLGLHWLYDQSKIKILEPETPEFHSPNASDYQGVPGYFAHAKKRSGDLSQYGEQALLMLRVLADNKGEFELARYHTAFCDYFGYGGDYVGYIDRATRDTLDNTARAQNDALAHTNSLKFDGDEDVRQRLVSKLLACVKQYSGAERREQLVASVRITDDNEENVAFALTMLDHWEQVSGYPGSEDTQLPAIAKLPPLVALYAGTTALPEVAEAAIRLTNNNQTSVDFGLAVTKLMEVAITTGDIVEVKNAAGNNANEAVRSLLTEALSLTETSICDATQRFGMSCDLAFGVPSLVHNMASSHSYVTAIRQNIYAGGDNCGRSVVLGALLGACFGVDGDNGIPNRWIKQLSVYEDLRHLLS